MGEYPGPSPLNWTCSDFPDNTTTKCRSLNKYNVVYAERCGKCMYTFEQFGKSCEAFSEPRPGGCSWGHRTRFCAKDSSSYIWAEYADGMCQTLLANSTPHLVKNTDHSCSVEGKCSKEMPACRKTCPLAGPNCNGHHKQCMGRCCTGGLEKLSGTEEWEDVQSPAPLLTI